MRKAFGISAIIVIMVTGATTATLAAPGDQYTLNAGGCLKGDKVNPPGSDFHCTEAMTVKQVGNVVGSKQAKLPAANPLSEPSPAVKPSIPKPAAK